MTVEPSFRRRVIAPSWLCASTSAWYLSEASGSTTMAGTRNARSSAREYPTNRRRSRSQRGTASRRLPLAPLARCELRPRRPASPESSRRPAPADSGHAPEANLSRSFVIMLCLYAGSASHGSGWHSRRCGVFQRGNRQRSGGRRPRSVKFVWAPVKRRRQLTTRDDMPPSRPEGVNAARLPLS
jgi:hypothetical protein